MVLTGPEIQRLVAVGDIVIDPFNPKQLNPNSYNLRLADTLLVYEPGAVSHRRFAQQEEYTRKYWPPTEPGPSPYVRPLDMAKEEPTTEIKIPTEGLVLWPGILYLAATIERTGSPKHRPTIDGRSSAGRLGLWVHMTAGYGDVGFGHPNACTWTLELAVVQPLRVYAGAEICQITFATIQGDIQLYDGRYNSQSEGKPQPSKLWKEFQSPQ